MKHLTTDQIASSIDEVTGSPKNKGSLDLIVCRPEINERRVLDTGELNIDLGLIGDNWITCGDANPEAQITIMNSRMIALIAQAKDRWKLAGDQLYIDMDLSDENLPADSYLSIGTAVLKVSAKPHNGCKKFVERFGLDAMLFVNSDVGRRFHLRGIYAKVVRSGVITQGDLVEKA
jgi:hypothetical protein